MAGGRGAGFDLYLRFLNEVSLMDDELSFSGLSRFGSVNPSMVGAYQYKISEPTVEPTHWSIFSEGDVNRIGGICGFRIVLYNYDNSGRQCPKVPDRVPLSYWSQRTQGGDKRLTLWHDARLDWEPEENEEPPPLCVFVATTAASPSDSFAFRAGKPRCWTLPATSCLPIRPVPSLGWDWNSPETEGATISISSTNCSTCSREPSSTNSRR